MPASASVRVVKAVPGPTIVIVLLVGRCSTMEQRFVEVSWTTKYSAANEGVTNAASPAAAISNLIRMKSSCVAVQDRTKSYPIGSAALLMRVRHQRRVHCKSDAGGQKSNPANVLL